MKKTQASPTSSNPINKKILNDLGAKKEVVGKTIFKLSLKSEKFLRQLAEASDLTIREFLDRLADIAKLAHLQGAILDFPASTEDRRMSYAVSHKAKEIFTRLAHENGVSRDSVVQSALAYIMKEFEKNALTPKEKIAYAKILEDARDKMLDIYESKPVREAREKLSATGDLDFADCEEKLGNIEQLYELDLRAYIMSKQNEINQPCD